MHTHSKSERLRTSLATARKKLVNPFVAVGTLFMGLPLVLVASFVPMTVHASAHETFCTTNSSPNVCANRSEGGTTQGSTKILGYNNDDDNNEYAIVDPINPCNSTPADEVTQTCPFTVGSGMNSANATDKIVQIEMVSGSTVVGCIGDNNSADVAVLEACGSATGSGGGYGTFYIQGRGNSGGIPLNNYASREWSDKNYTSEAAPYPVGLGESSPNAQLGTGFVFGPGTQWGTQIH
jgi:hypothetical protein